MKPSNAELENRFLYHPAGPKKAKLHEASSRLHLELATRVRDICPEGRNLSLALTALEDARMRANAAIACDMQEPEVTDEQLRAAEAGAR